MLEAGDLQSLSHNPKVYQDMRRFGVGHHDAGRFKLLIVDPSQRRVWNPVGHVLMEYIIVSRSWKVVVRSLWFEDEVEISGLPQLDISNGVGDWK
jgi:hypothetical protein